MNIQLRDVRDEDLPIFYEQQLDPEAARIAGVDIRDRDAFFAHRAQVSAVVTNITRTIEVDGVVAGDIGSWLDGELRLIGYRLGRPFWNRGIATRALQLFITALPRPLTAHVSPGNIGSWKVLERAGFTRIHQAPDEFTYELRADL